MPEQLSAEERQRIIRDLQRLTQLMDSRFEVPGTGYKVGLDPILGLIPGIGDTITTAISAYIIYQARRLGVSRWVMTRMVGNLLLDTAVGAIPLVGDLFDFAFKANRKNLKLLRIDPDVIDVKAKPL